VEPAPPAPAPKPRPAEVATVPPPPEATALPHRTFRAPLDRVWVTTEQVLKTLGWNIDKRDRSAGLLVTESRRLEGENFGLYAKDLRHRLRVEVKPSGQEQTLVSIEHVVFRRERIFWVNKDEPAESLPEALQSQQTEQSVLAAIGRAL
jgi:hypothetical protein